MRPDWIDRSKRRLLELRRGQSAWSYQPSTALAIEPTALSGLALLAIGGRAAGQDDLDARSAARWLSQVRRPSGALGMTVDLTEPGWPTPLAVLLWSALEAFESERASAIRWLLGVEGRKVERVLNDPVGHDAMLIGWPWVAETHSWVEPTAMAVLALGRERLQDHPRVLEGVRLLRDRAIPGGGWNLGNPIVFGTALRPLPGPTGLALLALAKVDGPSIMAARAIAYLRDAIEHTLAPVSLGWAILGLRAWGAVPASASDRLELCQERLTRGNPSAVELSLLLLAAGPRTLDVLAINPRRGGVAHAS